MTTNLCYKCATGSRRQAGQAGNASIVHFDGEDITACADQTTPLTINPAQCVSCVQLRAEVERLKANTAPSEIIRSSVREFMHQHDDGKCRQDCYGCFIVSEGERALAVANLQVESMREIIRATAALHCDKVLGGGGIEEWGTWCKDHGYPPCGPCASREFLK